ncbi:MAG: T9SS C-terminal target domain-containing protein, partial [Flavobacteriales bacterium]
MRRTLTVLFCVLFLIPSLLSQGIEWEQNFGGSDPDLGLSVRLTQDGGYIGAGASNKDYQCIKLTSSGTVKWDSIYGGSAGEIASSIQQTKDGGYILVGQSSSSDGDVSGNHGKDDEWVLKLDSIGQIEWEHNYGGDSADGARSVIQTPDGGYAIAGFSKSSNIDVSGNNGSKDYWILKLDPLGNIEWEKNYGGSQADVAYSIRRTAGGAYIVSGESWSSDKDVSGNNGMSDFWVLK